MQFTLEEEWVARQARLFWKATMPPTTQDVLDLNTDDLTDANTLPIDGRIKAVTIFAGKIENRLTNINQFLVTGPPIDPQAMTDLQILQASATNILALTNGILARYLE